jgi:energy-converting hydrogenase Eha subunit F
VWHNRKYMQSKDPLTPIDSRVRPISNGTASTSFLPFFSPARGWRSFLFVDHSTCDSSELSSSTPVRSFDQLENILVRWR